MTKPRVLLIEDDDSLREVVSFNLKDGGFEVDATANGEEALGRYDAARHAVVLTDLKMPGMDGMEVLGRILAIEPQAVVVVMTAFGSLETAVSAMRGGAFHYVEKPVNTPTLLAVLRRAVEYGQLGKENQRLRKAVENKSPEKLIISTSPAMNEVLRLVDKVADSGATIAIYGESGTGKELVARAIHQRSQRNDKPFVTVNCAAIPPDLLESLLFGHEKGAFTGANRASRGKFAAADGGTLFLDEIGEMSAPLQSKLLRVLQEGEIDVVGSNLSAAVDVRVISATHRDVESMVEEGKFREDLFYRLAVIPITIPPLRERREDIPVLFRHFIRKHAADRLLEVDRAVDQCLVEYEWPGNVRELENTTERMLLLCNGDRLTIDDVPTRARRTSGHRHRSSSDAHGDLPFELPPEGLDLMEHERLIISATLERMNGNQSATARYLSIPRHVLLYRMEKYGLKSESR